LAARVARRYDWANCVKESEPMGKSKSNNGAADAPRIDIGIAEKDREKIAHGLSRVLADTFALYLKTHNFHWNVEGPMFNTLHLMFMEQYTELWNALDAIAERIRSLGYPAPAPSKPSASSRPSRTPKVFPKRWTWCGCSSRAMKRWPARSAKCSRWRKRATTKPPSTS
jgi:starvation-inducible DNA-binding protein